MEPHQQRVVDEQSQLDEKITKLTKFMCGETFLKLSADERARMTYQRLLMREYSSILGDRIEAFKQ